MRVLALISSILTLTFFLWDPLVFSISKNKLTPYYEDSCSIIKTEGECMSRNCFPVYGHTCEFSSPLFIGCRLRPLDTDLSPVEATPAKYDEKICFKSTQNRLQGVWLRKKNGSTFPALDPKVWEEDQGCQSCKSSPPKISLITLFWKEKEIESFLHAANTWVKQGLLDLMTEKIAFIQEINEQKQKMFESFNFTVIGNPKNKNIGFALDSLVKKSTGEYVLLVEKDFALFEPHEKIRDQIERGIKLLRSKSADSIRLRSRYNPGNPNTLKGRYKGQEDRIINIHPDLVCGFYRFVDRPEERWPEIFQRCPTDEGFYCVRSFFCHWSNNPNLFKREFWMQNLSKWASRYQNRYWEHFLRDVRPDLWSGKDFIVAQGDGIFTHHEINED